MNSAARRRMASLSELAGLVADGAATTRSAIVGATGLSRAAIAQRVDLLIERGLLVETEPAATDRGRPPLALDLSDARIVVAGAIWARRTAGSRSPRCPAGCWPSGPALIDINAGPDAVLGGVRADLEELLAEAGRPAEHLRAVGIGVPGTGGVRQRHRGAPADHGRLGRLPGAGLLRGPLRRAGAGRQRRQHDGPRRVHAPAGQPAPAVREGRHGHRLRRRLRRRAAPRRVRRGRRHRPHPAARARGRAVPLRQHRLRGGGGLRRGDSGGAARAGH